jgi:hypothetical protein
MMSGSPTATPARIARSATRCEVPAVRRGRPSRPLLERARRDDEIEAAERLPGSRVLPGKFSSVQQAMGTPRGRDEQGYRYLSAFVEEMKATGFVADRIAAHAVVGLSVAPPA